ncbi:MAG: right-handed parallel beta-helix repeat-containing protein, partial [Bacteroidota bacterium]
MKKILLSTGFLLCSFLWSQNLNAQILYVNQAVVGGTGDGSSWTNAFDNLQDALSNTTFSTTEIWVAQGTYYPDEGGGQSNDDRFAAFVMQNNLGIYGGFDGTETMRNQRDFVNNVTILSGDIDQNDNSGGDNLGNSYTIVENNGNGLNGTAIIDGFTFTAANSNNGTFGNTRNGGGMYNSGGSPTVSNCIFEDNEANNGGGIANVNSNAKVSNCRFINNLGRVDAGGVYCFGNGFTPMITNCEFITNNADGGGGIYNLQVSTIITNCTFDGNTARVASAIRNLTASPTIINCSFTNNVASTGDNGLGISNSSNATITNCIVWNNDAIPIFVDGTSTASVTKSIVQGGFTGAGNKDQDPLFVDATNGDLRLQACSPAIDMGDNT